MDHEPQFGGDSFVNMEHAVVRTEPLRKVNAGGSESLADQAYRRIGARDIPAKWLAGDAPITPLGVWLGLRLRAGPLFLAGRGGLAGLGGLGRRGGAGPDAMERRVSPWSRAGACPGFGYCPGVLDPVACDVECQHRHGDAV